jgi:hypothetical protein
LGSVRDYKHVWLTFGGQDTDSNDWTAAAEQDMLDAGATGAAFDMEGGVVLEDMLNWTAAMRPKHPDWIFVHVPDTAQPPVEYDPDNPACPDYYAPMMYSSNYNSYPDYHVGNGGESGRVLKSLRSAGWPSSRIILTFQSFAAAAARTSFGQKATLLPLLGHLLGDFSVEVEVYGEPFTLQGPYAGVLGWPAQCGLSSQQSRDGRCWPDADKSNLQQIIEAARDVGVRV